MNESRKSGSILWGVLLIILGVIATMSPLFTALLLVRLLGWLLVFAGIEQVIHAFRSRDEGGLFIKVLLAVLYLAAGVALLARPVTGAIVATAIIGYLLIADGIMEIVLGARLRHRFGRSGWLIAGGVLSLLLGALVLFRLPWSMAAIGLLVGIRLIFKGIEQIARSSTDKRAEEDWERRAA